MILAAAVAAGVAEDALGAVAHGVVEPGDDVAGAGEVEVARAVGVGPTAVGPLGVDPGPGGVGIGVAVGAGGAALVLQLPQALALGAVEEPAGGGRVDGGRPGDGLGLLHRELTGGGGGDFRDELQVAPALQLLGRLGSGGARGASQPLLGAAVALAPPYFRFGDLGRRQRLHRAPGALDPLTERYQLTVRARQHRPQVDLGDRNREQISGFPNPARLLHLHGPNPTQGV